MMKETYKQTLGFTILAAVCFLPTFIAQVLYAQFEILVPAFIINVITPLDVTGSYGLIVLLIFEILFLVSFGVFSKSKGKNTRLLSFLFSCIFILDTAIVMSSSIYLLLFYRPDSIGATFQFLAYILAKSAWVYISYKILKANAVGKKLVTITETIGDEEIETPDIVTAGTRFRNYFADIIIIIYFQSYLIAYSQSKIADNLGFGNVGEFIFGYICIIIFYMIMEGIFSATPGKYLTSSRVVLKDGSKPSFSTIVKRSFCRLVPLEPLSAFNAKPWHDTWTETIVAKEIPIDDSAEVVENEETALEY